MSLKLADWGENAASFSQEDLLYLPKEISGDWGWLKGCTLVLQNTAPELLGIQMRKETAPWQHMAQQRGEVALKPTCQHSQPSSAVGCAEGLIFGRVRSEEEGAGNCHSAVLVSMTCTFITCAPWGKRHNLDSTADNSAVLCLWDKLVLL